MSTISTVTDRVDGEVLTAAKYNTDHGVHETNATNLNTGKVEISNYNTEHGPTGAHSEDVVRNTINLSTGDSVRFRSVTADQGFQSTGDSSIFHSVILQEQTTSPDTGASQGVLYALGGLGGIPASSDAYYRGPSSGPDVQITSGDNLGGTNPVFVRTSAPATPLVKTLYEDSIVKAWLLQGGSTTPVISGDINVSSIGDTDVGNRTINFATNMGDFNYAVVVSPRNITAPSETAQTTVISTASVAYVLEQVDSITTPSRTDLEANVIIIGKN